MKFAHLLIVFLFSNLLFSQGNKLIIAERDTLRIEIERLGNQINSEFNDYAPVITADGGYMYFTSRRPYTEKEKTKNRESKEERIYEAIWDEQTNSWLQAEPLPSDVNLIKRNVSNVAISNDGQRLLIYQDDKYGNGDIYEAYLSGSTWSAPLSLGSVINSEAHESSATIAPDGKTIYFVSERKGGIGGRDIWKATKGSDGEWGEAENLGNKINTKEDEEGVFIHPDGKTLYFSSKGHNTMGGYDIFKSELRNGEWSKPTNMGAPINTPEDELFFVLAANGKTGYYATGRNGGVINIYEIRFIPIAKDDKEPASTGPQLTVFKGVIKDCETGLPIQATIEVTDNEKNEVIATYNSNSQTGRYLISLPSGKNYGININAEGFLFSSQSFDLTSDSLSVYNEVTKDVCLNKIKVGTKVVLKNIFFDFNKSTLRSESIAELNRLKRILNDNSTMKIEIGGHTDSKGSAEYNKKLSNDRAQSVVNYLIENGISASRLTYIGYGKDQPVATNETEEGRQENRRVEFKVISK